MNILNISYTFNAYFSHASDHDYVQWLCPELYYVVWELPNFLQDPNSADVGVTDKSYHHNTLTLLTNVNRASSPGYFLSVSNNE